MELALPQPKKLWAPHIWIPSNWHLSRTLSQGGLVNGGMANAGHALVNAGLIRAHSTAAALPAPTAFWRMEETGNNDRADSTGNGNTLVVQPTYNAQALTGQIGSAINVTSTAGYVNAADSSYISFGDASWTAACWAYSTDWSYGSAKIFTKGGTEYYLSPGTNIVFTIIKTTGGAGATAAASRPSNSAFHCFVCGYDKPNARAFLKIDDGTLNTGAMTGTPINTADPLSVCYPHIIGYGGSLRVDCLAFWNVLLTEAQMSSYYNGGTGVEYYSGAWH